MSDQEQRKFELLWAERRSAAAPVPEDRLAPSPCSCQRMFCCRFSKPVVTLKALISNVITLIFSFLLNAVSKNGLGASRDEGLESLGLSSEMITAGNYMEVWEPEQAKRRHWSGSCHLQTSYGSLLELLGEPPQCLHASICSWNHPFTHKKADVFSSKRHALLTVLPY